VRREVGGQNLFRIADADDARMIVGEMV